MSTMDHMLLYTLQPLKMPSGTCPASGQERKTACLQLPTATVHVGGGVGPRRIGIRQKGHSLCTGWGMVREAMTIMWEQLSWRQKAGRRQERQVLACPGALGLRSFPALHGLAPFTASMSTLAGEQ